MEFLSVTTQWQHVSDEHFKFHKVVWRHYSGEVENVQRFCSKFIQETVYQMLLESPEFCKKILHKTFWSLSFFLYTLYIQLYSSSDYDSNSDHILIVIYLRLREHKLRPVIKFISQGVCCVAGRYLSHRRCRFEILKQLSRSKINVTCHQNLVTSRVQHITYSHQSCRNGF